MKSERADDRRPAMGQDLLHCPTCSIGSNWRLRWRKQFLCSW